MVSLTAAAPVAATPPTPASGTIWSTTMLEYRWLTDHEPPSWMRPKIAAAAADATESTLAATPGFSYGPGGIGWFGYTVDLPTTYAIGYATRTVPTSFGIRLRPHGYPLDWGTLRWCQFYENPPNGCYDVEMITLHEMGHVLTLGHVNEDLVTNWLDTVMHVAPKTKAKAGWNAHEFGRCDAARLQLRYGAASPIAPISNCLDLATSLSLSTNTSHSVTSGSPVTLTASLRVDPASTAGVLVGAPLAGRTVWLQRRDIGVSAWTDVAVMTGTSQAGSYSKSVKVTTGSDYRARFSAPATEGLSNAVSGVVRIYVGDPCVSSVSSSTNAPTC
jgi:hypothetical protein